MASNLFSILDALLSFPTLGALLLACVYITERWRKLKRFRLPPSPPSDFVIGHARRFPVFRSWQTFAETGKTLGKPEVLIICASALTCMLSITGDIFHYEIFGRVIIVVNSFKAAHELLDKRGVNTSGRLYVCSLCDL